MLARAIHTGTMVAQDYPRGLPKTSTEKGNHPIAGQKWHFRATNDVSLQKSL